MPSEQPEARVQTCLTCGTRVEVVSSDEGTQHYRPVRVEGLSDEDRARGEVLASRLRSLADRPLPLASDCGDLREAASLIDHQAKALEAADEIIPAGPPSDEGGE